MRVPLGSKTTPAISEPSCSVGTEPSGNPNRQNGATTRLGVISTISMLPPSSHT